MLAMNKYPRAYIDDCRRKIASDTATYARLAAVARKQAGPNKAALDAAIGQLEPTYFNNLLLVLENCFVHRTRALEKKDGNPLNQVRLLCDSVLNNNGKLRADKTIKFDQDNSVLKLAVGAEIRLSAGDFAVLSEAFLREIEKKFA